MLWEIDERAWLFIEPNAAQAGAGRITLAVVGLDALLERLAAEGIEHEPVETYSNGVRHVKVPDPDGSGCRTTPASGGCPSRSTRLFTSVPRAPRSLRAGELRGAAEEPLPGTLLGALGD